MNNSKSSNHLMYSTFNSSERYTRRKIPTSLIRYRRLFYVSMYIVCLYPFVCLAIIGPNWGHHHTSASVLITKQSASAEKKYFKNKTEIPSLPNQQQCYQSFRQTINELVTGIVRTPSPRYIQHALYWITAADAILSVILNEYSDFSLCGAFFVPHATTQGVVREVYSKLFYFARMRPRLLYSIGALLRAFSLCTPLRYLLDPTVGVGAGIHFFAYLAGSRWVKPLILGWATTKAFWTWMGARPVHRAYLPITLSIHEWEEKKEKKITKM